jgi:uncharacterized protein (DUF924 family)
MDDKSLQNELISFMFRRESGPHSPLDVMSCLHLWFGKSNETDIEIETRFGSYVAIALEGKLDHWQKTPRGCLALMILIDQFPETFIDTPSVHLPGIQGQGRWSTTADMTGCKL